MFFISYSASDFILYLSASFSMKNSWLETIKYRHVMLKLFLKDISSRPEFSLLWNHLGIWQSLKKKKKNLLPSPSRAMSDWVHKCYWNTDMSICLCIVYIELNSCHRDHVANKTHTISLLIPGLDSSLIFILPLEWISLILYFKVIKS